MPDVVIATPTLSVKDSTSKMIVVGVSIAMPEFETYLNGKKSAEVTFKNENDFTEEERIRASCKTILEQYAGGCLLLADELQAHNMAILMSLSVEEADKQLPTLRENAKKLGDRIANRILPYIQDEVTKYNSSNETKKQISLIRWGEVFLLPEFKDNNGVFDTRDAFVGTELNGSIKLAVGEHFDKCRSSDEDYNENNPKILHSTRLVREEAVVVKTLLTTASDSFPKFNLLGYAQGKMNKAITTMVQELRGKNIADVVYVGLTLRRVQTPKIKAKSVNKSSLGASASTARPSFTAYRSDEFSAHKIVLSRAVTELPKLLTKFCRIRPYSDEFQREALVTLRSVFTVIWPDQGRYFPKFSVKNGSPIPPSSSSPKDSELFRSETPDNSDRKVMTLELENFALTLKNEWNTAQQGNLIPSKTLRRHSSDFLRTFTEFFEELTSSEFKLTTNSQIEESSPEDSPASSDSDSDQEIFRACNFKKGKRQTPAS